jgi:hypothetical protein
VNRGIFLFLTFFNNILNLTRISFYLQEVARLVASPAPARQIAFVAPVHVAWQGGHAGGPSQRYARGAMTWTSLSRRMHWRDKAVAPCGMARQGQCPGPAAAPSLPPSLSFPPPLRPELQPGRSPQIRIFWGEKWGKSFPTLLRRYCP